MAEISGRLATKGVRADASPLSSLDTASLVGTMVSDLDAVRDALRAAEPAIAKAIDAIAARLQNGGRLVYAGAGTSGRLAMLDAAECPPTFGTDPELVQALLAGGAAASTLAVEAAEDDEDDARRQLSAIDLGAADAVLGLAASGRTPFVLAAVRDARGRGALTVGASCNAGSPLSVEVDVAIETPVGEELLSGSTRLKCGTAQKVLLNSISTIVMVRLGHTYGRLMVDVRPTNAKLVERALRIVETVAGVDRERAEAALEATGRDTKAAVAVAALAVSPTEARRRLEADGGNLDRVLGR